METVKIVSKGFKCGFIIINKQDLKDGDVVYKEPKAKPEPK